ncbi:pimeloyl-ACP methyl ester carboxylesterase [Rhodovulum bhavnagarense]|uniref:Pimeloyl-ACP methyl ester carboxylesterase n=1 Tax=Rhodovulum bhavnagarense TaxID=992286 RepID=A0A4R2RH70_9RHOB|nr:alpha/beta fold hydrolase [Rhodovulum bhavnagarense]TCP62323.1 pimeloyl-ACP methyl ester carboxylesterase [Rhodovulum bhavnagarense]
MSEGPITEFLLIHGSNHGAWCWRDVLPPLAAAGHAARAIDLPGAGLDGTPLDAVTLDSYRDAVLGALHGRTILVGHSLGGVTITAAAAAAPEKVAALVYLCAWAPRPGDSARDLRARYGCEALMGAMRRSPDRLTTSFADETLEELFYHDCPPGTADYARDHLSAQPIAPGMAPALAVPDSVPRHYIRCTGDRIIPPEAQADMTRDWPADHVHDLATGHSPFFADPVGLAELLTRIAEKP